MGFWAVASHFRRAKEHANLSTRCQNKSSQVPPTGGAGQPAASMPLLSMLEQCALDGLVVPQLRVPQAKLLGGVVQAVDAEAVWLTRGSDGDRRKFMVVVWHNRTWPCVGAM